MTPSILGLTFNDLTSLYRARPDINTSKSETDPSRRRIPKSGLTPTRFLCNLTGMIYRQLCIAVCILGSLLQSSCSIMQQQKQNQPPNSQEESVETKQKPPMYIGSVHQVYPERHFALLRIIGPMPKEGTVLISHPFDGTADRIGNLCVASGQHSRNGIIAADIRSGIVMKGDRIFQYRNIITEQEENAAEETASEESMVFEGLEQDVVLPEEIFTQDTPDYGVSRFNAITRQQPIEQEPQAPSPEEHEENLPEQEEDDTIIEPTIPNHTPGFRLQDIPDTIDGWDNM